MPLPVLRYTGTIRTPISSRRIGLVIATLALAIALISIRTIYLQVVKTRILTKWAQQQQQNTQVLPAVRGDIRDRNGQELAVGEERITLYATPKLVKNKLETTLEIARILKLKPLEKDDLVARMSQPGAGFVYVARQVPREIADKVIDKKIDGIGWYEEEKRIYPLHTVASQLLGYAGVDNHGLAGLEMMYDKTLSGRAGKQVIVRDPAGTQLDVLDIQRERDGRQVQLTLDATLQTETENVLNRAIKTWHAKGATAVVMYPRTGEIYALANVPSIDANEFGNSARDWQRNRAVTDTYEPGSTFKLITVSAALEEGLVTPTTSFFLQPQIKVADRTIKNSHSRPAMRMNVQRILIESDNIGTITIGMLLGRTRLDHWIRKFGFGSNTNIGFPGEVPGLVLDKKDWSGSTIGNVPIGQGIGVTAVQLAAAYAAVANDGVMVQPHILRQVEGEPPVSYPQRRIVSVDTARKMRWMLGGVVTDDHGTGRAAQIPGYKVAGKTGTANKAAKGVYLKGKYVASFIGFVPSQNPRLLTLVVVDEPSTPWGGTVAGPAFEEITQFGLQYLAIPPDGNL
jgi:cell division protein FtsI (penicillin-binding protein 3)/stage V sporulation protein D (sporulation-specific penicillin-binding protein)